MDFARDQTKRAGVLVRLNVELSEGYGSNCTPLCRQQRRLDAFLNLRLAKPRERASLNDNEATVPAFLFSKRSQPKMQKCTQKKSSSRRENSAEGSVVESCRQLNHRRKEKDAGEGEKETWRRETTGKKERGKKGGLEGREKKRRTLLGEALDRHGPLRVLNLAGREGRERGKLFDRFFFLVCITHKKHPVL
jgi:hypothetical protein